MELLLLFGFLLKVCLISSSNFECDELEKEMVYKNAVNIYIIHSFRVTNNNIYDTNISSSIMFPVNRTSYELPKIYEHLNGSSTNYSFSFNDSYYFGMFAVDGNKKPLSSKFEEACGIEEQMERFVIVLRVDEPKYSILLYGCNVVTGNNVIIAIYESKTDRVIIQELVKIDLTPEKHLFNLVVGENAGSCLCNSSRKSAADCFKRYFPSTSKVSVVNNMFYIYVGITFVMIIIVYVIHRATASSDENRD